DDVLSHCKKHLAKYKRPSAIVFMDEIPKNSTGKNLRRALKDNLTNQS
ncbi:AMP-binding enzyme, partial [Bacillus haynesii]